MSVEQISTAADLEAFINERCQTHWIQTRQALLLTALGNEVNSLVTDKDLLKSLGGLKAFIEKNVISTRLVAHSTAVGKIGIVPSDAEIPEQRDFLFVSGSATLAATHQKTLYKYFHSGFWRAFKSPLSPGFARTWSPSAPKTFADIPMGDAIPTDAVEIPGKFILSKEGPLASAEAETLRSSIANFIAERGMDAQRFVQRNADLSSADTGHGLISDKSPSEFVMALLRLSKSDQARISIPLDIAIELFRAR